MLNAYTYDARTVDTERWIFEGYLMAERETRAWNTVEALQTPDNKGWRVIEGFLMGDDFASCQSPQMALDKMTPNQPMVVKRTGPPERLKCCKTAVFKSLAFDQRRANQTVSFGPSGSIGHRHVHENHHVHGAVNIER